MHHLRKYQVEAHDATFREWNSVRSTLLSLTTSSGKTIIAAFIAQSILRDPTTRVLFIADRLELIDQPVKKFYDACGILAAVERASEHASPLSRCVIASLQTLIRRLPNGRPFTHIISDECFVAGTLVDGKPIESIKIGNHVSSFDENTGAFSSRRVTHIFKSRPSALIRVTIGDRRITCTPNHPFWTTCGWVPAIQLTSGVSVLTIGPHETSNRNLRRLQNNIHFRKSPANEGAERGARLVLREMPGIQREKKHVGSVFEVREGFSPYKTPEGLFSARKNKCDVFANVSVFGALNSPRGIQSDARQARCEGEGFHAASGNGVEADQARRKWTTPSVGTATLGGDPWMEDRSFRPNFSIEAERVSRMLQAGRGEHGSKNRAGDRREFSFSERKESARCEENRILEWNRVDSVAILQATSDGTFGGMCRGGFVYNLEIEGLHTYTANGVVVHNCHRNTENHAKIHAMYPEAKILGLSGTPFRKNLADLSKWYESVAFERNSKDMIADGYVCPIKVLTMPLKVDVSGIGSKAGDYDQDDVAAAMEPHYRAVAQHIKEYAGNRTILAFLPLIQSSKDFVSILESEGIIAKHADGTMNTDQRAEIIRGFEKGEFQVLSNSQLFSTGVDFIRADCLLNLALTRSRGEFRQRVGRIMRLLPNTIDPDGRELVTPEERRAAIAASAKPSCLLLDLLYQVPQHGLAGPACLFAESEEEEDEMARKIRKKRSAEDLEAIQAEVQADREGKLREALEARCLNTGLIDAKAYGYLLHDSRLIDYVPVSFVDQQPVTDEQRKYLAWARVDPATVNSFGHARTILSINQERKKAGLIPIFAVFRLKKDGIEGAEKMMQSEAEESVGEPLWGIGKKAGIPIRLMPDKSKIWWREKFFTESPHMAKKYPKEAEWCGYKDSINP